MKPALFLAANDVLSSPRRFAAVTLTFTLCLLLVMILVNTVNTLKSPGLVTAFALTHGDDICKSRSMQGIGTTADQYLYYEGTPPQNAGEIAVTKFTAEKLGVGIGDKVIIRQLEGEKEYMVTALFQSMNNT